MTGDPPRTGQSCRRPPLGRGRDARAACHRRPQSTASPSSGCTGPGGPALPAPPRRSHEVPACGGRTWGYTFRSSCLQTVRHLPWEGWHLCVHTAPPLRPRVDPPKHRLRQGLPGPWLTVSWKELAEGEAPGLARVQVGQREAQHAQCVTRFTVLQERQDAVCKGRGPEGR